MADAIQKIEPQEAALPVDPMVHMIERMVMDPNASIEKLERMLEMKERLEAQQAKRAFDAAIAEAKSAIPPILKDGRVDYTNKDGKRTAFDHETLHGIAKVVDPILSQHGLSYRYRSEQREGQLHVTCIVAHRDGYAEETTLSGSPDTSGSKNNYQAVGSAATYLQRYTLKLALGLSAAKDDDANAAGDRGTINADQHRLLADLLGETGSDEARFCRVYGVERLVDLPAVNAAAAEAMLRQRIAKKEAGE
jgi:hypothetical protein